MGQIVGSAAKPKRCNLSKLSQFGTPAAGEHILVSSDNSENAAGQGNFDCYIVGNGTTAATALELHPIANGDITENSKNSVSGGTVFSELNDVTENQIQPIKTAKSYIKSNGDIDTTVDAYSIYSYGVNAGEQYRIIGTSLAGIAKRYAVYSSETPSSASCIMVASESLSAGNYDVVLTIPENAVLLVVTLMTTNSASIVIKQRIVKNKIESTENAVERINGALYYEGNDNVDASVEAGKYITGTGDLASFGSYSLNVLQVVQGEKYRIVGNGMAGSTRIYGVYMSETMDATTLLLIGNTVTSYGGNYDVVVTIPYGGTILAVPFLASNPSSVEVTKIVEKSRIADLTAQTEKLSDDMDSSSMYCKINNQQLLLNYRIRGKIIRLTLKPTGGNNLFDFSSLAYKESNNAAISDLENGFTAISAGGTDWHAPFVVQAVNNIDGDNISEGVYREYFTGGNHQYNNAGSGSTPTARLISLVFYVDGKSASDFEGYCKNVRVEWANNVQGLNTTKADGTGREILQERHIMEFDGREIKEHIILTPLEDVIIKTWYGLQAFASNVNTIEFIGSDNRQTTNSANVNSISKKCRKMQLNRDSIVVGIEIDESLDLGTRDKVVYTNYTFGAFRNGDKYYCQIIRASSANAETYTQGSNYYLNAEWTFD